MSRKKRTKTQRRGKQTLRNAASAGSAVSARPAASRLAPQTEFDPDYSYITKDLKRIGVLAGSFLAILIALSFFL